MSVDLNVPCVSIRLALTLRRFTARSFVENCVNSTGGYAAGCRGPLVRDNIYIYVVDYMLCGGQVSDGNAKFFRGREHAA